MPMDLPPHLHERVVCSIAAAVKYGIPANIMLAVAEKEGGKAGQWVRNANGTHDVGPLQFNTAYLRQLSDYGITPVDVAAAGCFPYQLAAWRLRQHIKLDAGDLWTRCANYHSRTPRLNAKYREDLVRKSIKWAEWLVKGYQTQSFFARTGPAADIMDSTVALHSDFPRPHLNPKTLPAQSRYVPRTLIDRHQP